MTVGQNTVSGDQLRSYVERLERLRAEKKALGEDEKVVKAEAKAAGFDTKIIGACVKIREMKPHDWQEADALLDMYLHALGMAPVPPLFRAVGLAGTDLAAREQVVEKMKDFVPPHGKGDITVSMGGKRLRLMRAKEGEVVVEEVVEQKKLEPVQPQAAAGRAQKEPPPDVDEAGAEQLGRDYAIANRPIIDNPFPFGDKRRPRFDVGWRKEAGSDGMGPDE